MENLPLGNPKKLEEIKASLLHRLLKLDTIDINTKQSKYKLTPTGELMKTKFGMPINDVLTRGIADGFFVEYLLVDKDKGHYIINLF